MTKEFAGQIVEQYINKVYSFVRRDTDIVYKVRGKYKKDVSLFWGTSFFEILY